MAHIHDVYDSDRHFSIDKDTRQLKNQNPKKTSVMQFDHNSERITFEIPRMIDGHDMSTCNVVEVHFINKDARTKETKPGLYPVADLQVSPIDPETVICSWLVSIEATQLVGPLAFRVTFKCSAAGELDYSWSTAVFKDYRVSDGINNTEITAEEYHDLLAQWQEIITNAAVSKSVEGAAEARAAAEAAQAAAEQAKAGAETAKTGAEAAQTGAAASAQAAAASAQAAAASEKNAEQSAKLAENQAHTASDFANVTMGYMAATDIKLVLATKAASGAAQSEQNAAKYATEAKQAAAIAKGIDVTAKPGQLIRVKEVDKEGKPTAWEPVPWGWVEGETTHPIPGKFLPEGVPYVERVWLLEETDAVEDTDPNYGKVWVINKAPSLTIGETYTFVYNGTSYECVCKDLGVADGSVALGNLSVAGFENTGEPFAILANHDKQMVVAMDLSGAASVRIGIIGKTEIVHPIPGKLLPDGAAYVEGGATVGQTVRISAVDENGVPTAWEAVDFPDSGGNIDQSTERYLGDLKRTPIYPCLNIYLDGDTTGMTKDDAVMLNILILDEYGNVKFDGKSKTAWQGSGSLSYPNKNLSLKLRDKNDEESKVKLSVFPEYATSTYHLKCNYADYSMVRNSVGAKMAKGFDDTVFPVDAPMVVSSIPAILYLNGEFNGCYTLNTKQDDDLFGMDTKENPLTQIVYRSGFGSWTMSNFEYRSDGTETAETKAKLQRLMDFCANADDTTFVRDFENYLSLRNAINYWIFADVACASDSMINNWTIGTWDGLKWYMIWYDLDIIFGLFRNGGISYHPSKPTSDLLNLQYTVANPLWAKLYRNFFGNIKERYWELRNSGALTPSAIVNQFRTFQSKWGTELIEKDRAKWTGRLNKSDDIDMMYGWISERLAYLDEKYTNKVLTGISVTYTGGNVEIGTSLDRLTGITVTASYDNGSNATVTGYTLTGEIAEGSNIITVSYEGMVATFTVTGVAESGGEDEPGDSVELPAEYTRLNYIEGTGTQYIDTEKVIHHHYTTDGDEFYLAFALMSTSKVQVLWNDDSSINSVSGNQFAYVDNVLKDFTHIGITNGTQKPVVGNRYAYWCGYTPNEDGHKAGLYDIDNSAWSTTMYADHLLTYDNTTRSMTIMGKRSSKTGDEMEAGTIASMRLYEYRYVTDGVKVIHLVPALDADGKPCMYDLVEQKALYNKGTGEFLYA